MVVAFKHLHDGIALCYHMIMLPSCNPADKLFKPNLRISQIYLKLHHLLLRIMALNSYYLIALSMVPFSASEHAISWLHISKEISLAVLRYLQFGTTVRPETSPSVLGHCSNNKYNYSALFLTNNQK